MLVVDFREGLDFLVEQLEDPFDRVVFDLPLEVNPDVPEVRLLGNMVFDDAQRGHGVRPDMRDRFRPDLVVAQKQQRPHERVLEREVDLALVIVVLHVLLNLWEKRMHPPVHVAHVVLPGNRQLAQWQRVRIHVLVIRPRKDTSFSFS